MNRRPFKVGDAVRIAGESESSINYEAGVYAIGDEGIVIANANMPYMGTIYTTLVPWEDVDISNKTVRVDTSE